MVQVEVDDQGKMIGGVARQSRVDDPGVPDIDLARVVQG